MKAPDSQIEQLPVGIHFNVPDDIYFGQDALGSTDKKQLALDPVEWQFKRLHLEDKNTPAKIWGSGLHARTLEGAEAFGGRFRAPPVKPADALVTREDLASFLKAKAVYFKSSDTKPILSKMVREIAPNAVIWDEVMAKFTEEVPEDRRLTPVMVDEINLAAEWMQADPMISPIMEAGTFKFGSPELTVIYDLPNGIRCRARFDYMIPGRIIDLKRYSPWRNGNPLIGITQAIGNFRYDLQAADYLKAFDHGAELYRAGMVFGPEPYEGFLEKTFGAGERPKWVWVFVKGEGAPQPRVVEMPHDLTVFKIAETQVEQAIENYRRNVTAYGLDRDWSPEPGAIRLADEDFPAWFGRN
jgi:hypothetical protein